MTRPTAKPKKPSAQRDRAYAEGGSGPDQKMFGKGDRAKTATIDSAGPQQPGRTGQHPDKAGGKFAEGGGNRMVKRQAAEPAMAGKTGKKETPAGSPRASGGLSLSVKPKSIEESRPVGGLARPALPGRTGC